MNRSSSAVPTRREVQRGAARLACVTTPGAGPTVVFLPGYASNMNGTKALHLERLCLEQGRAFLRLDYQGHGESSGAFADGTLGAWADDALAVIDAVTPGPLLLVGSSMGGWIALLAALRLRERVAGLVGIAAAPDFGDEIWNDLAEPARATLRRDGLLSVPSDYGPEPGVVTLAFIEESRRHNLLGADIAISCPVRLLHGMADPDVPFHRSLAIAERVVSADVRVTLLKGGGHRLSEPSELALIGDTVMQLAREIGDER